MHTECGLSSLPGKPQPGPFIANTQEHSRKECQNALLVRVWTRPSCPWSLPTGKGLPIGPSLRPQSGFRSTPFLYKPSPAHLFLPTGCFPQRTSQKDSRQFLAIFKNRVFLNFILGCLIYCFMILHSVSQSAPSICPKQQLRDALISPKSLGFTP